MEFIRKSMHRRVNERMIEDMAIEFFNLVAPEAIRMRTPNGDEYFRVEGLVFDKTGESNIKRLNLGCFAPMRFDAAGDLKVDLDEINANLEACKAYLRAMDEINIVNAGGYISESYKKATRDLNRYILRRIQIRDQEALSK